MGTMNNYLLIVMCFSIIQTCCADKHTLHVGALFELSIHWFSQYVNFFIDIVQHAFAEIENNTDILKDYSLKLIAKDAQGNSGIAARRLFELMTEGPPIVAVLGPSLSSELTVVGQITPSYDILHLSYVATTSSTIDREKFSTMFKVNQILDSLNPLRIKMMQYFGWTRVGTLFFGDDINVSHMNYFHELLKHHNLTLVTSAVVSDEHTDLKPLIARLLHYDVRIVMASFRNTKAPGIFCEAFKQGLYGSHYVWILPGPGMHLGWMDRIDFSKIDCTYEEFLQATDGHITLNYDRFDYRNITTISKSTPDEVKAYFEEKISETDYLLSASFAWVYDTAWALAVGLNNSLQYLNESGLNSYTNNKYYLDAIMKGMVEVNFAGVSGPVSFDATGGRAGVTFIEQNFKTRQLSEQPQILVHTPDNTRIRVAMYDESIDMLQWLVPAESLWPDRDIPRDRFTYRSVTVEPNLPSLVLITIINTFCCAIAVGFLSFNIYFRRNSNIKLSSPMINNIIIAGSVFMYICVFLTTLDYGHLLPVALDKHICMLRVWIMCLGFTSLFGALFSKTWRVHILFRDYKLKKTTIKDWHLFGIIVFLLMIDCILMISWTSTHRLEKKQFMKKTMDNLDHNEVIAQVYSYCHNDYEGYWFVTMYIYKGLLLAFGTFLAWETRHVTVPALNDSKYIGFCIYNVVIVCVFGVPLMHVLPTEQTTLNFVLLSAFVMFCTTMCLCILFIPKITIRNKVSGRFLNPSLNERTAASTASASYQTKQRDTEHIIVTEGLGMRDMESSKVESQNVDEIKNEINKLRKRIADDTVSIERLKQELIQANDIGKSPKELNRDNQTADNTSV